MTSDACAGPTGSGSVSAVEGPDLIVPQRVDESVVLRLVGDCDSDSDRYTIDGVAQPAVFVGGADSYHDRRQPVAGRHEDHGGYLTFTPAFAFVAGQDYVVRTRGNDQRPRLTEFRIPPETSPSPALVTDVYPSGDVLPENVLRFYVHFSVPMRPHLASEFITLRDASGVADRAAFMRFKQELWNADRTRLTILIDPGRIKRSVATNLDLGPALLQGGRYALTIDEGWPSADGASTLAPFSKPFRVAAALRDRPDVGRWTSRSPRRGTHEALEFTFDRPFDRHLLRDALRVVAGNGQAVDGTACVGQGEASWSFAPQDPWPAGDVLITVDDRLEDVAGNNFNELLDRELQLPVAVTDDTPTRQGTRR